MGTQLPRLTPVLSLQMQQRRLTQLNRLTHRIVTAIVSQDPQGLREAIRILTNYCAALLEALEVLTVNRAALEPQVSQLNGHTPEPNNNS